MIDLKKEREFIKSLGNDVGLICDYVDYMQSFNNLRLCPRNIYCDEISNKICANKEGVQHQGCRRRFATCFKEYFKEKEKQKGGGQ